MGWWMRLADFFSSIRDDGETREVVTSAIEQKVETERASETSRRNHAANGRLRDAVRAVRSSAFSDFEAAVKRGEH